MASITTRQTQAPQGQPQVTVAGVPLTNTQLDNNFINLNTELSEKLPLAGGTLIGDLNLNFIDAKIKFNDTSGSPTDQSMQIRAEAIDVNLPGGEGLGLILESTLTNGSPDTTPAFIVTGEIYAGNATITSTNKVWHAGNDGSASGLDADLLDGQQGSYYLDWTNVTNKPDPQITVTLTGDVTGTANTTLTDLASGTVSVATTIAANSVALGTDTTGNYVAGLTAGTGITIGGTAGEGWSPTVTNSAPNVTTDISITHAASSVTVNSSDGADGTINAATTSLAGVMTAADKTKLDGIATGAQTNQNAFSNVAVSGQTTVVADNATDTLTLVAGTNVTITTDAGTDSITISATDTNTTYTGSKGITLSGTDFRITGNEIPGSIDLNTYRTTGFYAQNANADAASGTNYPTANAGILQVINDDYGNGLHTTQLYSQYNSINYYHRTYYNGSWTAWRNLAQDTNTTYSKATSTTLGLVELGSDTVQTVAANTVTTTASRTYAIQLNAADQMVVNVPWTDTTYTVSDGTLGVSVAEDGTTGNSVYITTGTGFSANTASNYTYDIHVGPSLKNLADTMTGATTGFLKKSGADTYTLDTNTYLTGNQTITLTGDTTGSGTTSIATTNVYMASSDDRTKAPSDDSANKLRFGFTSWNNNNSSPYADYLHLRSYTDSSGGNDNLVMFRKDAIGMRIWQQAFGSGTAYATYKDVAFTDQLPTVNNGTFGVSIGTAGATNTTVTWGTASGFSANTASNSTYDLKVGPALTALASIMTGAGTGFIRKNGADTYLLDTNTYLTAEADTLATVTGRGASTSTRVTLSGGITSNATSTRDKISVWSDTGNYVIGMQNSITFGAINNNYAMTFQMNNDSARGFWWGDAGHSTAQGAMSLSTNGLLTVASGARIGFGESDTTIPTIGIVEINGLLTATQKSFTIAHPTKPGKKLRYGSLEGPENGVYVRGKIKGNVIELPEYWTKLVDSDSITVQLTPIGKHQKLYVEDIRDNKVYIVNDGLFAGEPHCFYFIQAERIDVDKLEVEI